MYDTTGNEVVTYTYDTWGKLISIDGTMKDTLGLNNPYRYRGYRYDTETGLYYLQSRYYNPEWGRFINTDAIVTGNEFAYCDNNPVNYVDPTGFKAIYGQDADGNDITQITPNGPIFNDVTGNIVTASSSLPKTGEPNSKGVLRNPDGSIKQEREYGPDGQPTKDTDYNHGGVGHKFPHEHDWKDGKRQPGVPVSPANNQAITPSTSDSSWWVKPTGVGFVIVSGVVTIVLIADDATGIGAFDDPLIAATGGGVAKGLEMILR